jgi:hypothetical protein
MSRNLAGDCYPFARDPQPYAEQKQAPPPVETPEREWRPGVSHALPATPIAAPDTDDASALGFRAPIFHLVPR